MNPFLFETREFISSRGVQLNLLWRALSSKEREVVSRGLKQVLTLFLTKVFFWAHFNFYLAWSIVREIEMV